MEKHPLQYMSTSEIEPGLIVGGLICCKEHFEEELGAVGHLALLSFEREKPEVLSDAANLEAYLFIAVGDGEALSIEQFQASVDYITNQRELSRTVYVHCLNGFGRSPSALAAYFVSKGMSVEDAVEKIKQKRPLIYLNSLQFSALYDYKKSLMNRR